jgi:hypothetical protein
VEVPMSLKDKLEIGLKPDAPYRPDNLPDFQQDDPACEKAAEPGTGPEQEAARESCAASTESQATIKRSSESTSNRSTSSQSTTEPGKARAKTRRAPRTDGVPPQ